jgi:predicted MFS family arabinose efflux permease
MRQSPVGRLGGQRDFLVLAIAQFSLAFAMNFMFVFLPFYVHAISPLDEGATLRWTGIILGAASAMAVFGSTFWGNLTDRFSPKTLFVGGLLAHAVLVAVMSIVTSLPLLLAIQLVRGFVGGISTIGLIIVSAISRDDELPQRMGTYQSALTLGQIFSPPLGAAAATMFGFRGAFLASSLMMFGVFLFAWFGLCPVGPQQRRTAAHPMRRRRLWLIWLVSFAGTIQIVFLPSILPTILQGFGIVESARVTTAGLMVFAYGVSAAAGSYGFSRLAVRIPAPQLMLLVAGGASCLQVLLLLGAGPVSFTLIRMAQTACAAGIFPLVLVQIVSEGGKDSIGFVNAARFAGNAVSPVIATFTLAHANLATLYVALAAALGLAALGSLGLGGRQASGGRDRTG